MAGFDAAGMLQYCATMVAGLPTMQHGYLGVSESVDSAMNAWTILGDMTPKERTTQSAERFPEVWVTLMYRVRGAEATAELKIGAIVDELTRAVYLDRTLGGTSTKAELDMSKNNDLAYMDVSSVEVRRYIVIIRGHQTMSTP